MIYMNSASGAILSAPETFGRDGAMFESLLGFVAQLSLVLWALVLLTTVMRSFGMRVYRRGVGRASVVETSEPSPAMAADSGLTRLGLLGTPATEKNAGRLEVLQQSEGAVSSTGSVAVMETPRDRHHDNRPVTHVPAFAVRTEV